MWKLTFWILELQTMIGCAAQIMIKVTKNYHTLKIVSYTFQNMTKMSTRYRFYYKSESIRPPLTEMCSTQWHLREHHLQTAVQKIISTQIWIA